jgi:hypothetical protein
MRTETFILKSGKKLVVTEAPFEASIALVETCKRATLGLSADVIESVVDQVLYSSSEVRKALYAAFDTVLYDTFKMGPGLFDDAQIGAAARGDYYEICSRVIEVNTKAFFLKTSSASTTTPETPSKSPGSP